MSKAVLVNTSILIILFFLFYGLYIPTLGVDISVLINLVLISVLPLIIKNNYFFPKIVAILFAYLIFDLCVCVIVPIFYETYEFSIIKTKVNFIVSMFNIYQVSLLFFIYNKSERYVVRLLNYILLIQSIIIIISLLNPTFGSIVSSISRSSETLERMSIYDGARGLGLSSFAAFGLAVIYAVLILILFYSFKKKYISLKIFITTLLVSIVAGVSSGRSSLISVVFGLIPYALTVYKKITSFAIMILLSVFLLLLLTINPDTIQNSGLAMLYSYALEPVTNFIGSGEFTTSSTDVLIEKMYFPITTKQFFLGDGVYIDTFNKNYYLGTDAGYMRFILYYGIFFSIGLYLMFINFMRYCYFIAKDRETRYLIVAMAMMSFILHYKGEIILFAISYNIIMFLFLFTLILEKRMLTIKNNR